MGRMVVMADYAIMMTSTDGLREQLTSALNGIALYGMSDKVDVYLIGWGMNQAYLDRLPSWVKVVPWADVIDHNKPARKKGGWEVRFYRYTYVPKIEHLYKAIMILDADSFIVDDFTHLFDLCVEKQTFVAPYNLRGMDINKCGLEGLKGAASPPFHCHGFIFPTNKYEWLIPDLYKWACEEDYGDMSTLARTLFRHDEHKNVIRVPNELYCFTNWFYQEIELREVNGLRELHHGIEPKPPQRPRYTNLEEHGRSRMAIVHGRWGMDRYLNKYLQEPKGWAHDVGEKNAHLFRDTIRWLNKTGPIQWKANDNEVEGAA